MTPLREFVVTVLGCLSANMIFWYLVRPLFDSLLQQQEKDEANNNSKTVSDTPHDPDRKRYLELVMAVQRKFPDESRHETALRYIQEAERNCIGGPAQTNPTP